MGLLIKNAKAMTFSKLTAISVSKGNLSAVELEKNLYKPISEFNWKDASRSELNKEKISHYSKLLAL